MTEQDMGNHMSQIDGCPDTSYTRRISHHIPKDKEDTLMKREERRIRGE